MEKNDYICKMVEGFCNGTILDLGCGNSFFCDYLQRKGFDVTAVDINSDSLKIAKKRNNLVKFVLADITNLRLKKKYDTILLFGVLDYLVDIEPVKFMSNLKRFLNKGGCILLQVANSSSLQKRLKTLLDHEPVEVLPHYDFNEKRIKKIIDSAGYTIIKFTSTKLWTFRTYRPYMPFDNLATEFFIIIKPKKLLPKN